MDPNRYSWKLLNFTNTIARFGVPVFFMINVVLFLNKPCIDLEHLWLKNILHLLILYIVWSILYAIDFVGFDNWDWIKFKDKFLEDHYHMWFIPAMITIYIITPILHAVVNYNNGKYESYMVVLFIIFGILKYTVIYIPHFPGGYNDHNKQISRRTMPVCSIFYIRTLFKQADIYII